MAPSAPFSNGEDFRPFPEKGLRVCACVRSSVDSVTKPGYFFSLLHRSEGRAFRREGGWVEKDRAGEEFGGG